MAVLADVPVKPLFRFIRLKTWHHIVVAGRVRHVLDTLTFGQHEELLFEATHHLSMEVNTPLDIGTVKEQATVPVPNLRDVPADRVSRGHDPWRTGSTPACEAGG